MTPYEFIQKWQGSTLNERQSYQAHFTDLCALVGVAAPSPATADSYCFERGVAKTGSRHGWADVWMRGCFGFEYKAPDRNLERLKNFKVLDPACGSGNFLYPALRALKSTPTPPSLRASPSG